MIVDQTALRDMLNPRIVPSAARLPATYELWYRVWRRLNPNSRLLHVPGAERVLGDNLGARWRVRVDRLLASSVSGAFDCGSWRGGPGCVVYPDGRASRDDHVAHDLMVALIDAMRTHCKEIIMAQACQPLTQDDVDAQLLGLLGADAELALEERDETLCPRGGHSEPNDVQRLHGRVGEAMSDMKSQLIRTLLEQATTTPERELKDLRAAYAAWFKVWRREAPHDRVLYVPGYNGSALELLENDSIIHDRWSSNHCTVRPDGSTFSGSLPVDGNVALPDLVRALRIRCREVVVERTIQKALDEIDNDLIGSQAPAGAATEASGYHVRNITKGTLGEASKVREELEELEDALEQRNAIMALCEMADLYGALKALVTKHGRTMDDLRNMDEATARAFRSGKRA